MGPAMTSETFDEALGRRLRAARHAAGLDQCTVAERLGVGTITIMKYERGTFRIPARVLSDFSSHYGVTIESLLGSEPVISNEAVLLVRRPGALTLLRAFGSIMEYRHRKAVIALAEGLKQGWRWST